MTSKYIYTPTNQQIFNFQPTFLYIKQHIITGKLYFGKHIATSNKNIEDYNGSGSYWLNHISKYGKEQVITLWYCLFLDIEEIVQFGLSFSHYNNIVESEQWANQMPETGLGGASKGCKGRSGSWDHINKNKQLYIKTKEEYREIFNSAKIDGIHPMNSLESYEKSKNTMLNRHGIDNCSKLESVKNQKRDTFIKNHGCEQGQSIEVQNKAKETFLENYGVDNPFKSEEIKNKIKQECLLEHGVEYHQSRPEIRAKIGKGNTGKKRSDSERKRMSDMNKNMVTAINVITNERVKITKEEFDLNPEIYVGSTAKQRLYISRTTGELFEMYSNDRRVKSKEFRFYKQPLGKENFLTSSQMVICCLECKEEVKKNVFTKHLKKHNFS